MSTQVHKHLAHPLIYRLGKLYKSGQHSLSDLFHEPKIDVLYFVFSGMVVRIFVIRIDVNCIVSLIPEGSFIPSTAVLPYYFFNTDI